MWVHSHMLTCFIDQEQGTVVFKAIFYWLFQLESRGAIQPSLPPLSWQHGSEYGTICHAEQWSTSRPSINSQWEMPTHCAPAHREGLAALPSVRRYLSLSTYWYFGLSLQPYYKRADYGCPNRLAQMSNRDDHLCPSRTIEPGHSKSTHFPA
jgi:hypothetical protein